MRCSVFQKSRDVVGRWRAGSGASGGGKLGFECFPPGVEGGDEGLSIAEFFAGGGEAGVVVGDGGIGEFGFEGGGAGLGFEDALFEAVVLALLVVAEFLSGGGDWCRGGGCRWRGRECGRGFGALFQGAEGLIEVGVEGGAAAAVKDEDFGSEASEHGAVVGDEDDGTFEGFERFFEDLKGGDVEIVGGFVEDEDVGGLEHHARDVDAGELAAGEIAHLLLELFVSEEEAA